MKKKQIVHTAAFLLLVTVLLCGLTWLLRDRTTTLSALYSEDDDTVDVLIVGSSHVNSGYIPNVLWENNHLSACNVYSWSQPMWVSYHYIRETLKTQSPRYVVLEMYGMMYGHSYIMPEEIDRTNYANSFSIDPGLNRLGLIWTSARCGLDLRDPTEFLNLIRYHSRWKYPSMQMLTYNAHDQHDYLKGYGFLLTRTPLQDPALEMPETALEPYEYCVEYLEKIRVLCEQQKIQLIFTLAPYVYSEEEMGIYRWIEEYSSAYGIPFMNYNGADGARIGFDFSTDLSDNGHCNYYGAMKLSLDLSRYMAEHYPTPDKTENPAWQQLDEDLACYHRLIPLNTIMSAQTLEQWLDTALADNAVTLLINDTGANAPASAVLYAALEQRGCGAFSTAVVPAEQPPQTGVQQTKMTLFGKTGTVAFSDSDAGILLNGTSAPAAADACLQIVLYDTVLDRPVESVWLTDRDQTLYSREFTSDIIANYQR